MNSETHRTRTKIKEMCLASTAEQQITQNLLDNKLVTEYNRHKKPQKFSMLSVANKKLNLAENELQQFLRMRYCNPVYGKLVLLGDTMQIRKLLKFYQTKINCT